MKILTRLLIFLALLHGAAATVLPTALRCEYHANPATIDTGCTDADGRRGFDGRSMLAVLKGETGTFRDHVFGVQTTRGIINGTLYPIRSVRDARYKFIRNLNHQNPFQIAYTEGGRYHQEFFLPLAAAARESTETKARLDFFQRRPAEELYDLDDDPHELHNLATSTALDEVRTRLSRELDMWMRQQGDLGIETESAAKVREW